MELLGPRSTSLCARPGRGTDCQVRQGSPPAYSGHQRRQQMGRIALDVWPKNRRDLSLAGVEMQGKARIAWVDGVRAVGVALVVLNHASVPLFWRPKETAALGWMVGVASHALSVSCVHLFFLASGFLTFQRKNPGDPKQLAARLLRLGAPWATYTAFYAGNAYLLGGIPLRLPWTYLFWPAAYHLWFFAPMVLIAVLGTLLRPQDDHRKGLGIALGLLLLANGHAWRAVGLPGDLDHELSLLSNFNQVGVLLSWFLLTVVGYHLGSLSPSPRTVRAALGAFVVLTLFIGWATVRASLSTPIAQGEELWTPPTQIYVGWLDDLNGAVLLHAVCLFIVSRAACPWVMTQRWGAAMIQAISKRSLGIYGLHLWLLGVVGSLGLDDQWLLGHPGMGLPVIAVGVLGITWAISALIARIDRRGLIV